MQFECSGSGANLDVPDLDQTRKFQNSLGEFLRDLSWYPEPGLVQCISGSCGVVTAACGFHRAAALQEVQEIFMCRGIVAGRWGSRGSAGRTAAAAHRLTHLLADLAVQKAVEKRVCSE